MSVSGWKPNVEVIGRLDKLLLQFSLLRQGTRLKGITHGGQGVGGFFIFIKLGILSLCTEP